MNFLVSRFMIHGDPAKVDCVDYRGFCKLVDPNFHFHANTDYALGAGYDGLVGGEGDAGADDEGADDGLGLAKFGTLFQDKIDSSGNNGNGNSAAAAAAAGVLGNPDLRAALATILDEIVKRERSR